MHRAQTLAGSVAAVGIAYGYVRDPLVKDPFWGREEEKEKTKEDKRRKVDTAQNRTSLLFISKWEGEALSSP